MQTAQQFRTDAESFYDTEAVEKGYIVSKDRDGSCRTFPLITVSAVILELPALRSRICFADEIGNILAEQKKNAKNCPEKICIARIGESINFEEDKIVFKTEVTALSETYQPE